MKPKTYLIGYTCIDQKGLDQYLTDTNNLDFLEDLNKARDEGISAGEMLCSFYAKLCYKSLSLGQNANVTKIRPIQKNLEAVFDSGHGSVFEHCWLNFVTTDCSRVFTHELVRHRVGISFSQTSGRYVAIDKIDMVLPPELQDDISKGYIKQACEVIENTCIQLRARLIKDNDDFTKKKKITSAIRRLAPNGQTNEIGWSCNIRTLRHLIELRTGRHAEWEIRLVFNQVADIILERFPNMLYGHSRELVDGLYEYVNLKI